MISWMVIVVAVGDNKIVIGLVDVDPYIDDDEEAERRGIYIGVGGERRERYDICVGFAPLYLLWHHSISASMMEEEEKTREASMSQNEEGE